MLPDTATSARPLPSLYDNPHLWDKTTKNLDDKRFRIRVEKFLENSQLPHSVKLCMVELYIVSMKNYRPDGLIDIPINKFWEKFNVTKMTFSRWIKKLSSEDLIVVVGSTNQRRICVKWSKIQSL